MGNDGGGKNNVKKRDDPRRKKAREKISSLYIFFPYDATKRRKYLNAWFTAAISELVMRREIGNSKAKGKERTVAEMHKLE